MAKQRFFRLTPLKTALWLIALLAIIAVLSVIISCASTSKNFDEAVWRAKVKSEDPSKLFASNVRNGRFYNPWLPREDFGIGRLLRWKFSEKQEYTDEEKNYLPEIIGNAKERIQAMPDGDFIMWVGHATFLIRVNGQYWLTDPIFSNRAFLPERKTPPALTAEEIAEIAPSVNIIISHNHYDHLDKTSIQDLPAVAKVYVPLGLGEYIKSLNKSDVTEMDWWQTIDIGNGATLVCLPMQHWSRRIGQGVNETLWASFMLITSQTTIYFGGDTGYFIGHEEIGKRYPNIDYALLPTTAYHPRWFMHHAHMNIDEMIEAFNDLNGKYMIPHQWGTFHLGDEPPGYPALDLKRTIAQKHLDPSRFIILNIGEIHRIPSKGS
jgi:N-acyl-phosphatidylethanolamine-hydrolysing phospholipase D